MRRNHFLFALTAVLAFSVTPSAAQAADTPIQPFAEVICEPNSLNIRWASKAKSNVLTHKLEVNVADGTTGKKSITVNMERSVTAGVTFNQKTTISADVVIASLEGELGLQLASNLAVTNGRSETFEINFNKPGRYIVFDGVRKATGRWVGSKCNSNGTKIVDASGSAISWTIASEGAVNCASKPEAGSMPAEAKKYC